MSRLNPVILEKIALGSGTANTSTQEPIWISPDLHRISTMEKKDLGASKLVCMKSGTRYFIAGADILFCLNFSYRIG